MKKIQRGISIGVVVAFLISLWGLLPAQYAYAAALFNKSDTMSSLKVSTASNHEIVFRTPTGAADSSDTITITFPSGWAMGSVAFGDMDVDHSAGSQSSCSGVSYANSETLAETASATAWGAAVSGQVVTLTAPTDGVGTAAIATNACIRIKIGTNASGGTNRITNSSSAASHTIAVGGAFGDSGDIVVTLLSDDQVVVSATVDESLTFSVSDNTIGFGMLSASSAVYANGAGTGSASETEAHTLIVGTNASNGYTMTITGNTLTSGANTVTAIGSSNTASSVGTEQFGVRMTASGGSGAVSVPYADAGFALDTEAFPDEVASASVSTANTTYSARYLANISSNTEAGTYASTLTYTATANF